jgi:hypothetical protein
MSASHQSPPDTALGKPSLAERAREELHEYAIIAAYLFVCFSVVLLYKTSILRESGVAPLPFGFAAVKALILGKFMLLGAQLRLGLRFKARTLLHLIIRTAFMYLLLLVVLTVLEEIVAGWVHGHSFAQTMAEFGERSPLELLATVILMFCILLPYVAVREISQAMGPRVLKQLLWTPRG